jgi:hypothetical protein
VSGASSRRKGHDFERALVHAFRAAMPSAVVRRGLQSRGTAEVADIDCPVFFPEAKRGRKPNVRAALAQARAAAPAGRIPLAVIHDDRAKPFVAIARDALLDLVRECEAAAERGAGIDKDEVPVLRVVQKHGKKPNVRIVLAAARLGTPIEQLPVAEICDEGAEPFAVLRLDDFLEVVRVWWAVRPKGA